MKTPDNALAMLFIVLPWLAGILAHHGSSAFPALRLVFGGLARTGGGRVG